MATLKLNKKNAGPPGSSNRNADGERRAPIRGKGLSRPRQSLERVQAERQERQAQYEQGRARPGERSPARGPERSEGPRGPNAHGGPRGPHAPGGPRGQQAHSGPRQAPRHGSGGGAGGGRDEGPRFDDRRPARRDGGDGWQDRTSGYGDARGPRRDAGQGQGGARDGHPGYDSRGPQGAFSGRDARDSRDARDTRHSGPARRDEAPRYEDRRSGPQGGPRHDNRADNRYDPRRAGAPVRDNRYAGRAEGQGFSQSRQDARDPRDHRGHWDSRDGGDARDSRTGFAPRGDARPAHNAPFDARRDGHRDQRQDQRRASGPRTDGPRQDGPRFNDARRSGPHSDSRPARPHFQSTGPSAGASRGPSAAERAGEKLPDYLREAAAKLRRQLGDEEDHDDGDDDRGHHGDANSEGLRLSKQMGLLGMASRREADEWIAAGWVRVDGKLAILGQRVSPDAKIEIDPLANKEQAKRVTILLHKPIGYVSGQAEDGYENASVLVKSENHWSEDPSGIKYHIGHSRGLAPAGRLDIDSTGLLVLTQDGRIAKLLIGEDSTIEKEYLVRVEYHGRDGVKSETGRLPDADLALLNHGLELDGVQLKPAKVSWQNEDQLRFVLREGRKRQIRRMCEQVGLKVVGLKRVRIGRINLGHLPAGQWRFLSAWERFD